ncbi:MAG: hypothetical protein OXT65_00310 [Alphaproteobacteria bacterium]|nr:hypothetical protein [Alphaproteobacteria bacterium]
MTQVTVIFNKDGAPLQPQGGDKGMALGIDDIPAGTDSDQALRHVFSCFAMYDYSFRGIDFDEVTFKFNRDGHEQEEKFTPDQLQAAQMKYGAMF